MSRHERNILRYMTWISIAVFVVLSTLSVLFVLAVKWLMEVVT